MQTDPVERQREQLLDRVLQARTQPEIDLARRCLDAWLDEHPDDVGMTYAYDRLAKMQEVAELRSAEQTAAA